jgi:hypothetical protein
MEHSLHSAHRRNKRLWPADVTSVDRDAALFEPGCFLVRQGQHANTVATFLERRDKVPADEAVASGDK